jgi:zinc D-Ala-D-Ala carboxypeptidase
MIFFGIIGKIDMYKYFKLAELKCKCGQCSSTGEEMNHSFMQKIEALRAQLNFPFAITSAYRCPTHNTIVSSSGMNGAHTTGRAIDIAIARQNAYRLVEAALSIGLTGIGVNQKGASRFIHLDDLTESDGFPRPTIWSY